MFSRFSFIRQGRARASMHSRFSFIRQGRARASMFSCFSFVRHGHVRASLFSRFSFIRMWSESKANPTDTPLRIFDATSFYHDVVVVASAIGTRLPSTEVLASQSLDLLFPDRGGRCLFVLLFLGEALARADCRSPRCVLGTGHPRLGLASLNPSHSVPPGSGSVTRVATVLVAGYR